MQHITFVSVAILAASLSAQLPDGSMPGPHALSVIQSAGGVGPAAQCASLNPTATLNTATQWASAWFAHKVTGVAPNTIVNAFSFLCRQNVAGTVTTGIYDDAAGLPGAAPIVTGTMSVGPTSAYCTTTLTTNYTVGASGVFWIATNNATATAGFNTEAAPPGTNGLYYWNGPAWSGPWNHRIFAWTVDCGTAGQFSNFGTGCLGMTATGTGTPNINNAISIDLAGGTPNSSTILQVGASNSTWLSLPLPFDLAIIGSAPCFLRASGEVQLVGPTTGAGTRSVPLFIPNNLGLVGASVYTQFLNVVLPRINTSNGVRIGIGV